MNEAYNIPFHKPTFIGAEQSCVQQAIDNGKWVNESLDAQLFFKEYYPNSSCFFVNSCSSALEMAIRALEIGTGDEVIIPGFGYVAVANAVVNNGATPVFADVLLSNGNIDEKSVEACITNRTKAIIGIHYAGNSFDIVKLLHICNKFSLYLIEDAAQSIGSCFDSKPLGSFGHLGCLSFDYMKNITCGQGGLLVINHQNLLPKVQTIYDNGINKNLQLKGSQKYYNWVGTGNNHKINPIASYFLTAQLKAYKEITIDRIKKWNLYHKLLKHLADKGLVALPDSDASHNGHIFYLITKTANERKDLQSYLRTKSVFAEHHYSFLPDGSFGKQFYSANISLQNSQTLCSCLLRLPLWHQLSQDDIEYVVKSISGFYNEHGF